MTINFREASTKRGIVMTITGSIVLYRMLWGHGISDVDALLAKVDWWLGIGLTLVGMLGLLPDEPPRHPKERTRETDLPEIELQGRSNETTQPDSFNNSISVSCNESIVRLRENRVSSDDGIQSPESAVRSDFNGYNG